MAIEIEYITKEAIAAAERLGKICNPHTMAELFRNFDRLVLRYNTDTQVLDGFCENRFLYATIETWHWLMCYSGSAVSILKSELSDTFEDYIELARLNHVPRIQYNCFRSIQKLLRDSELYIIYLPTNDGFYLLPNLSNSIHFAYNDLPREFVASIKNLNRYPCALSSAPITTINEKENKEIMKTPSLNFEFGPITDNTVVMSPYGLAVSRGANSYVAYNAATNKVVDVTGFTFDFGKFIYKVPAAVADIKVGDLIYHNNKPVYVTSIENGDIVAIDYTASEKKTVIPISNLFGFDYVTRVVSWVNFNNSTPNATNPFGNLMPMMFMSSILNGDDDSDFMSGDMGKFMMMSMFMGGQNPFANFMGGDNTQFTIPGFNTNAN